MRTIRTETFEIVEEGFAGVTFGTHTAYGTNEGAAGRDWMPL